MHIFNLVNLKKILRSFYEEIYNSIYLCECMKCSEYSCSKDSKEYL